MKKVIGKNELNQSIEVEVYEPTDFESAYSGAGQKPVTTNSNGVLDSSLLPPTGTVYTGTVFYFNTPLIQWTVNHNLGYIPLILLFSTGGVEIEADVLNISNNQVQITFNQPQAGFARVF